VSDTYILRSTSSALLSILPATTKIELPSSISPTFENRVFTDNLFLAHPRLRLVH